MPSSSQPPAEDREHAFWRDAYQAHGADLLAFLTSRAGSRADAEGPRSLGRAELLLVDDDSDGPASSAGLRY